MASAGTQTDSLTPNQRRAVSARGNVLVMAGAGTGKTRTLVERCLDCLARNGVNIDELLIVTFTEAAAAEMRSRLRREMETRAHPPSALSAPDPFWEMQLARFDLAQIGTLHGFCLRLVREHFYELGLDPQFAVLAEGEARQLANETLDRILDAHYGGEDDFSATVQDLIQAHGGGRDEEIRRRVLQLHHYSQARPDAAGWLARQRETFDSAKPTEWERWLPQAVADWRNEWVPYLETLRAGNEKAAELIGMLAGMGGKEPGQEIAGGSRSWRTRAADAARRVVASDETWPKKRKMVLRKPLEDIFDEAEFLLSLLAVGDAGETKAGKPGPAADASRLPDAPSRNQNGEPPARAAEAPGDDSPDPLVEDWNWVHRQMATLLRLAEEFAAEMAKRKLADGVVDFHDLEQFALKLLWDFPAKGPTAIAAGWRAKLKYLFVDEYQDINAAQDQIITALAAGGAPGNRFLVGDVKQSIYRFRLADARIFRDYAKQWRGAAGATIPLAENFRSRAGLLDVVNSLFRTVMREGVGGVSYDAEAELKGGREAGDANSATRASTVSTELLLRFKSGRHEAGEGDARGELEGLADAQLEARLVARRLQDLMSRQAEIVDSESKALRRLEWRDITILLRSPRGRSQIFAREFELAGIPLAVARQGFYQSAEILDLVNLLQLLDNPLQDLPCVAVLRSPLVGLSLEELAEIRLALREGHFWTALVRSRQTGEGKAKGAGGPAPEQGERTASNRPGAAARITEFLERYHRWRRCAKQVSLSECLEQVLGETLYVDWLRAQPRGAQRAANVAGFLRLAQQFDQFQRSGLYRFLKFVEVQAEAEVEPEVSPAATENAVRLMSIHQSKGLEFPAVVVADLAKRFNEQDLHGEILFDEEFGICPMIKPPGQGGHYPSLAHWLAQRRQKRELRGEELRLLYVALTRARDYLFLTASISEKHWEEKWLSQEPVTDRKIVGAKCDAEWLALWFAQQPHEGRREGTLNHLRWRVEPDQAGADSVAADRLKPPDPPRVPAGEDGAAAAAGEEVEALRQRLAWAYPFAAATRQKAKSSVTALRRAAEEPDEEAAPLFAQAGEVRRLKSSGPRHRLTAAEIGAAHHKFLQYVRLDRVDDPGAEAERLRRERYLSDAEHAALDLGALRFFWNSTLGREIRANGDAVRRELPFTARFSPGEIAAVTGIKNEAGLENESVIVQGVADLVVLRPKEIWLVDFKTDEMAAGTLAQKVQVYSPQLRIYAAALEGIFGRKVTRRALHFLATGQTEMI